MDTPLAASVHKENVRIGGGKSITMMKPDKTMQVKTAGKERKALAEVKTAGKERKALAEVKTAGKERKALADLKSTFDRAAGESKDVDFKQKSAMQGNQVKRNPMAQGKERKAVATLVSTKKPLVSGLMKDANLNNKSALLGNFGKINAPLDHILTDEEIKQCYEWAKDGIEEMGGYSFSAKDEADIFMNQNISEIMASAIGVPISELESPFVSDDEGYETDGPDLLSSLSFPGHLSSIFAPEELEDPVGLDGIVLDAYPLPELKLNEDLGDIDIDLNKGINGGGKEGGGRRLVWRG